MAQLVEQRIRNAWVAGSSPAIGSLNPQTRVRTPTVLTLFLAEISCKPNAEEFILLLRRSRNSRVFYKHAELAQLVEHWLPKPRVAGSSPVFRSENEEKLREKRKK